MRMTLRAAIVGASGYAGGELIRLLSGHPDFEVGAITAAKSTGTRLGAIHPQLWRLRDRVIEVTSVAKLDDSDVIFLA